MSAVLRQPRSTESSLRRWCGSTRRPELREISFRDLPLYSYDYDADYSVVAREFKQAIADAVLFVTLGYNRSIPGGLKRALSIGPVGLGATNSIARKPSAVIGASIGATGTAVAQQDTAKRAQLLQLAANEFAGSLHTLHIGSDYRRWHSDQCGKLRNSCKTSWLNSTISSLECTPCCRVAGEPVRSLRASFPPPEFRWPCLRSAGIRTVRKTLSSDARSMGPSGEP